MKKILLFCSMFAYLSLNAQMDTLANHFTGTPTVYLSDNGGYLSGNSGYEDKAKMQLFDPSYGVYGSGTIEAVLISIPIKNDGGGTFKVKLWEKSIDGKVGAELATSTVAIADVDTTAAGYKQGSDFFYNLKVDFNVPIPANRSFWAGIELPTGMNDTVALTSTEDGDFSDASTHTGEFWSDNSFHTVGDPNNWNLAIAWAIFPVINVVPPANDNFDQALELTVGSANTCNMVEYSNEGATQEAGYAVPSCAANTNKEVWFYFTAPANGGVIINSAVSTTIPIMNDGVMGLYSGTWGNLIEVGCNDDNGSLMPSITATGLTPGETYYIAFASYGFGTPGGHFNICVTETTPPANDNFDQALELTVGSVNTCNMVEYSNEGATQEAGYAVPSCAANTNQEVWFYFTAPANGGVIINSEVSSTTPIMNDGVMGLYSGTWGSLIEVDCDDNGFSMPSITATGLTPGETYYIAFAHYNSFGGTPGHFNICVSTVDNASIGEHNNNQFKVYPNPTNSKVTVEGNKLVDINTIELRDQLGRLMEVYPVNQTSLSIDLLLYSNGIYTLTFKGNKTEQIQKIQVLK